MLTQQHSCYEDIADAASVFVIALVRDDAFPVVRVEHSENLTWEEIAMDINLDLSEVEVVVGRTRDGVSEMSRVGARLESVKAMLNVYIRGEGYILICWRTVCGRSI